MALSALAFLALVAHGALAATISPCGLQCGAEHSSWSPYRSAISKVNGQGLSSAVGGWTYTLPWVNARKGIGYMPPNGRLRRVVAKMMSGKPVKVVVLGGSISAGASASRKRAATNPNDVWSMVSIYLKNMSSNIDLNNQGLSATKSYVISQCVDKFLPSDPDLVFMEYIANDGSEMDSSYTNNSKARSYERFMRKVLSRPTAPAVVQVNMLVYGQDLTVPSYNGQSKLTYYSTPEDTYNNLAQYYGSAVVSFRDALYQMGEFNQGGTGGGWADFMTAGDGLHPIDLGHKYLADLVVYMLQQVMTDLTLHPITDTDLESATAPLPPPMYDGNVASPVSNCWQGNNLTDVTVSSQGWTMAASSTNNEYPTWGYTTTGSSPLTFEINTASPNGQPAAVNLYYTKAQSGMGTYQISCDNGCTCDPLTIDGKLTYSQTVVFMSTINPTVAPKCHINVQLASGSPSGSSLRVSGVSESFEPGVFQDTRIGEEKYLAWLSGTAWAP